LAHCQIGAGLPRTIARSGGDEKARIGQVVLAFGQMHAKPIGPAGTAPCRKVGRARDYPFQALLNSWGEVCVQR
jgi:hypothetical protein